MKITLLDRYLFKQAFMAVLLSIILFTVIWLAPETLFKLTQAVAAGKLTLAQAFGMFLLHIPTVLLQTIPMAAFLGSLFLFRRLSQDFELIAMMVQGISQRRILIPVLAVGLFFSAGYWLVQEILVPRYNPRLEQAYVDHHLKKPSAHHFVFIQKNAATQAFQQFVLIGKPQEKHHWQEDMLLLSYYPSDTSSKNTELSISQIMQAKKALWVDSDKHWLLQNVTMYRLDPNGVYQSVTQHASMRLSTSRYIPELLGYVLKNPLELSWQQLAHYRQLLLLGGQTQELAFYELRLIQKWLLPLAASVFVALGALVGIEPTRSRQSTSLTFGAIVLFAYCILIPFSTNIGSLGILPTWLMAGVPLIGVIGLTGLYQRYRHCLSS